MCGIQHEEPRRKPLNEHRARDESPWRLPRLVGLTVARTLAVVLSLLAFPSAVPWMVAAWLVWHTILVARHEPGWAPLAVCGAVVLVKRVPWPPVLIVLGVLMLAAGLVDLPRVRRRVLSGRKWLPLAGCGVLWVAWAAATVEWHAAAHTAQRSRLEPDRPVVCMGDSLTSGMKKGEAFPEYLSKLMSVPVVNLAEPGITTEMALARLPALAAANPQAVVIELGGNDYLSGESRAATRANLERILAAAHGLGARVVLVEIPRGFVTDGYAGLERELARKHDLELVPDTAVRKLIHWSPYAPPGMWLGSHYSDDGGHPNERGARMLAAYVAVALERIYGPAIRKGGRT